MNFATYSTLQQVGDLPTPAADFELKAVARPPPSPSPADPGPPSPAPRVDTVEGGKCSA